MPLLLAPLWTPPAMAQTPAMTTTAVFVSNTEPLTASIEAFGNDDFGSRNEVARGFTVGNAISVTLTGVTITFGGALGTPGNIAISLWSANGVNPGSQIALLSGPNPASTGNSDRTYTPTAAVSLTANTRYFIVLQTPNPVGNSSLYLFPVLIFNDSTLDAGSAAGWNMDAGSRNRRDGGAWGSLRAFAMRVDATCANCFPPVAVGTIAAQRLIAGRTLPDSITLDVSGAFSDGDGDTLTYTATSSAPSVVVATVSGSAVVLTAGMVGDAQITVRAADALGSAAQTFMATVAANSPPVAVGTIAARMLTTGLTPADSVMVDLSNAFMDANGSDVLTYTATSSAPAVVAASISGSAVVLRAVGSGTAQITVRATDRSNTSATHTFAAVVNSAPVAAGTIAAQRLTAGRPPNHTATLPLSTAFTDADGDVLSYSATSSAPNVATAAISGGALALTALSPGSAQIQVRATDPHGEFAAQSFGVTVVSGPVAVGAIAAQALTAGLTPPHSITVNLAPAFRDADGDALSYSATSSAPAVARAGISGSALALTAGTVGTALITVRAADPSGLSATQSFTTTVALDPLPIAAAGVDLNVQPGASVVLDGSGSFAQQISYGWRQTDGGAVQVALAGANSARASFAAPVRAAPSPLEFTLTVTDAKGRTASDSIQVNVAAVPLPVARAGADASVAAGASVRLDGGGSSGRALQYSWRQVAPAGVSVQLRGAARAQANFMAPVRVQPSALAFALAVTDVLGRTSVDAVTVTVALSGELVRALEYADTVEGRLMAARMQLTAATSTLSDARMQLADVNAMLAATREQLGIVEAESAVLNVPEALAAAVVQRVDINGDGVIDEDDFLIMYTATQHAAELGGVENGAFSDVPGGAAARARLLGGMRGAMPPGDAGLQMLLVRVDELRAAAEAGAASAP